MHRWIALVCFVAAASSAVAGPVRVFIAPRSSSLPRGGGKMPIDVYWINTSERWSRIPAVGRYSFSYSGFVGGGGFASVDAQVTSHPPPDRRIAPGAIVRDRVTVDFDAQGAQLLEVSAEFDGQPSTFKSNTVVLVNSRR